MEAGWGKGGQAHLFEVALAAPAPRTGGGDRPPLRVQSRESLSSGSVGHASATAGAISHICPIALRSRPCPTIPEAPTKAGCPRISPMC